MDVRRLTINLNRLSHELSGAVADRERLRIETQLAGLDRCPDCGAAAGLDSIVAPPPVDATEYGNDERRLSALTDYRVGVQFSCGDEVDLESIDGLDVTLRDGPIDVDYAVSSGTESDPLADG